MHKKFQVNLTKIKGGCQSETKAAHCFSCTDLTLVYYLIFSENINAKWPEKSRLSANVLMWWTYISTDFALAHPWCTMFWFWWMGPRFYLCIYESNFLVHFGGWHHCQTTIALSNQMLRAAFQILKFVLGQQIACLRSKDHLPRSNFYNQSLFHT